MAKSNRRKRQDRVKAGAKRNEQARRRAKAEREQQTAERYRCLLDPRTSPADVAGILAAELPDSLAAGAMMQIRLSSGVPGEEIAQTARLMLASATGPHQIGTLAVAAWAAHVTGDEDAERGYGSELLSRAVAGGDWLEQSVAVLDFRSPRHSAASAAEGSTVEALRLESLLRQLEYQAGLAAARGERPIDTEWLRSELGLTAPLSERLDRHVRP